MDDSFRRYIKLLPVRVRHIEKAQTWLLTLLYTPLRRIRFKAITFVNVMCICVFHGHLRPQG